MLLEIPDVLDGASLDEVRRLLARGRFRDGRASAGDRAREVKRNQEADLEPDQLEAFNRVVLGRLYRHPEFQRAALPHRVSGAFAARYRPGMEYGLHSDDPVMGRGASYRSDVAITVFLSEPADYDGGELGISTEYGEHRVKLPGGSAVIYPSGSLHRVCPITRGERLVAVAWAQSLVRDPARRELLYRLDQAREAVRGSETGEALARLDHVYANLTRMWAEV